MTLRSLLFAASLTAAMFLPISEAQTCQSSETSHAYRIKGINPSNGALTDQVRPEAYGRNMFTQVLPNGWVFALMPIESGWSVRVYDHAPVGDAVDLTAQTPPLRGAPNPRDIEGWHFRNQNNTGPNTGDVNAPQLRRAFVITPSLAGTGGLRLPEGEITQPAEGGGLGLLEIKDMGLSQLQAGERARMSYLQFDACLRWPKSEAEVQETRYLTDPEYLDEEIEIFGACGLDYTKYALDAQIVPRHLSGDIDGDGAADDFAQIRRLSDGARGLAMCRAGTWIDILGFDGETPKGLPKGYVGQTEAWRLHTSRTPPEMWAGWQDQPVWPSPDGDVLELERIEKEMYIVFWKDDAVRAMKVYGHVER